MYCQYTSTADDVDCIQVSGMDHAKDWFPGLLCSSIAGHTLCLLAAVDAAVVVASAQPQIITSALIPHSCCAAAAAVGLTGEMKQREQSI